MGEFRERIRISYHERSDRESYPSLRDEITQSGRTKRLEKGFRRETTTDFIDLRVGEATPLGGGIFDDPLTLEGAFFLVILSRGVPEQHFEWNN